MDYDLLLLAHSWLRWIILVAAVAAIFFAFRGPREGDDSPMKFSLWFTIALDLQLLLGILLLFVTPWFQMIGQPGTMADNTTRFWSIEHGFGMLIAIVIAHVTRIAAKRAANPAAMTKRLAIGQTIALVIILLTIPWPFMEYGRPLLRW